MSTNETDVNKIIERVEVAPAGDDEETVESPDSSQDEETEEGAEDTMEGAPTAETKEAEEEESEEDDSEETEEPAPAPQNAAPNTPTDEKYGEVKRVPGETPKEFALRIENARLRDKIRGGQAAEIMAPAPAQTKKELSPEKKAILAKFKPEEMATFREALEVVGEEMGFVKKDELGASTYQEKASEVLDNFLEKHPEYQPANDPESILWNAFKTEYAQYKTPQNPRDLAKILTKVHREVYGIKPAAALDTKVAAKRNVQVASHSGASRPNPKREGVRRAATPVNQGLRTDMLKGFSDEELADFGA